MTEIRDIYYLGNPQSVPEIVRILSGIFNKISNRLDRMEGLRDTPTFYKDHFKFITENGLSNTTVLRATGTQTAQFGSLLNSNLPVVDHEHGGLEADVSAYDGIPKISGGATSELSITSAGEELLDGLVNIYDENGELIHQFHIENIPHLSEVTNFLTVASVIKNELEDGLFDKEIKQNLFSMYDENETVIHQFPIDHLAETSEVFGFY